MNESVATPEVVTQEAVAPVKYGVSNTIDCLKFGFDMAEAIVEAKKNNGKYDVGDIVLLYKPILSIDEMIKDIKLVPKEILDIDTAEGQEIYEYAKTRLSPMLSKEEVLVKIEVTLKWALATLEMVKAYGLV